MIDVELLSAGSRTLTYVGSVAVAGAMLFAASFPRAADAIAPELRRQAVAGFALLLVAEPLRYLGFQLAVAEGDWALAFGPDMRWLGLQTPMGNAAGVRLIAAAVIVFVGLRVHALGLAAALIMIGSFLLQGHTVSGEPRLAVAALLLVHLAAVHWWLGALLPLSFLTRRADPRLAAATVAAFSARAVWVVVALLAAGIALALTLTGAELRPASPYQQRLLVKLVLVAAVLGIAARNKMRLVPLLKCDYALGAAKLRASIRCEIAAALAVLTASAWLVGVPPDA
ncbi:MAG: CopD family protein [Gammaproteobacteria bacterium]|nr:CopD family protein [Gammaproteobacteria bacterium]